MHAAIREAWATALESGKYEQGIHRLKRTEEVSGTVRHCSLGVLCELAVEAGVPVDVRTDVNGVGLFDMSASLVPRSVGIWAGLVRPDWQGGQVGAPGVQLDSGDTVDLITANDVARADFAEIARSIRRSL